jgi:sugar/nucleoside kinase (ribokinase family)
VSARLVVVGSLALDDIEAPSGKVGGVLGGAASHFAVAASYFGPVSVVGVIGADFPREHLEFLKGKGVDTSGIEAKEGRSFRWGGRYSAALEKRDTLFTELGVFDGWQPELAAAHRGAPFVFLANIHPEIQLRTLEQVRAPRFTAMDTMNFWIDGTPAELRRTLARVNGLVINDEEARQLTGESNLVRAATAIHALGPKVVIVKRGEHGALLFDDAGIFSAPAFPLREVQDPTGAGDSFAGGFMGALAASGDLTPDALRRAVIHGSVMASFCVERFSLDRLRALSRAEVDARFEQFRALTRF